MKDMAEEAIEWAWAQSLMRFVHLGEQVRTKGGKLNDRDAGRLTSRKRRR
jgi:hypothetical protein